MEYYPWAFRVMVCIPTAVLHDDRVSPFIIHKEREREREFIGCTVVYI